ncbi:GNAT family N-acetyltransferase [Psychromonas sp. B3M02]|uniref:GNAT family N-acetyltransferase n=1 Tax=Psychromonas sp. B3M02 TaxID=2267226 RepID=UPI000DE9D656|nr:GNAT family N-acetyltransferase [Psychromonas sp. B3M02]RBW42746.1 GNAT family N-acetyltransferase [Psychromonas sp. B3M02]
MVAGYKISSDPKQMDLSVIHGYLSGSYWAKGIPLSTMQTAINNSFCFGVFTEAGQQVAFARMITDYATSAYLADVFVLPEHRGKGLSKWLVQTIIDHPQLQGLRRMLLATSDAHNLYRKFGFSALASPELFMELHRPNVYQTLRE